MDSPRTELITLRVLVSRVNKNVGKATCWKQTGRRTLFYLSLAVNKSCSITELQQPLNKCFERLFVRFRNETVCTRRLFL